MKTKQIVAKDDLFDYYKNFDPEINRSTFAWRIYDLKARGILQSTKRGFYTLSSKKEFKPILDKQTIAMYKKIINHYSKLGNQWVTEKWLCIWNISWMNEFMEHQLFVNYKILEVERYAIEGVYYWLSGAGIKNVFLNPDKGLLNRNVINEKDSIVLKTLFSRSPLKKVEGIFVPTLEKILVDIFYETDNYFQFQGNELSTIFRNAIEQYSINFGQLLNYARRRRVENEIRNYIRTLRINNLDII